MNATVVPLANFVIGKLIHQSDRTAIYRGRRKEDSQPVVIKLMRNEYPSFKELVQFRNQYAIAKTLDIEGVVKPYALERYENRYVLIMEDSQGISLEEFIKNAERRTLTIPQFLQIAIQLADLLHHLHRKRVIHKDIKPANILIHPETQQVKLIDFSISSLLPKETQTLQTPNRLEGTLAYLSPEQTGRMNRGIDYRSDFYSLGVTFYKLLSGKLPFASDDPLELVHCHIAKIPEPLEDIPAVVADIIMKLMAKNAEDRYQSALGLKHDLEKCLRLWQETRNIEGFELAESDRSDRFAIPEKLYGRESEVQTLLAAFHRVANGSCELMLVAGFSGIGKTAVINEVHKPIVCQRGYFIKGKFDQFQRNIPFSAFVQAFRDLMGQLLGESDAQLATWKSKILKALGENGQVIIEVIPELERIIDKQPTVPELSGSAAQNRFNLLFEKFIQVFTTPDHPLVMFIDDLQWVDSASLKLMQLLMSNSEMGNLLLLGAYRDNEVCPAHPLMLILDEICKSGAAISTITLAPLSLGNLNCLVADTLSCELELALPLTTLLYQKTKGNPFFATQFLKGLHEDGWITFDGAVGYWQCDMTGVRQLALTDNVVEFMANRLYKLPEKTQQILKLAACIGNQFDLATLAIVCEQSAVDVAIAMWAALQEGLVLPVSDSYKFFQDINYQEQEQSENVWVSYKFLHDRVQQAAYSLIEEYDKQTTHRQIGDRLLQGTPMDDLESNIFKIVNQFNRGRNTLIQPTEKEQLAKLNLLAARKAKASSAYNAALEYCNIGLDSLDAKKWEDLYDLMRDLHLLAIELEYLNSHFDRSQKLADSTRKYLKNILDNVAIYQLNVQSYIVQNQMSKAINAGREGLQLLGCSLLDIPEIEIANLELPCLEKIRTIKEIKDCVKLAKMKLLASLISPAYLAQPYLFPKVTLAVIQSSTEDGYSSVSAIGYGFGALLFLSPGYVEKGYQSGQISLKILEHFSDKENECKLQLIFNVFIRPHKEHGKESCPHLLQGWQSGLNTGDFEYASYCAINYCNNLFYIGRNLKDLEGIQRPYEDLLKKKKLDFAINFLGIWRQLRLNLLGDSLNINRLIGKSFNEETKFPQFQESNSFTLLFSGYVAKSMLLYLLGFYADSLEQSTRAVKYINSEFSPLMISLHKLYYSLALLAIYFKSGDRKKKLEIVESNQETLQKWATYAPMNFQHKSDLIEAEKYRVLGKKLEAMEMYDRAIAGAKENEYIQEEALANELAGKFYLDWGKEQIASTYIQQAYYGYAHWGARAKIEDLEKRYPTLLTPILERPKFGLTPSATLATLTKGTISKATTETGELLDLATLMKASRTLSENIELEGAIANLMQVVRENAAAETVALMLFEKRVLMLAARVCGQEAAKFDSLPVETSNAVPLTIVNKVKRSQQPLLLENASQETAFAGDGYIQQHQPQSILCLPLVDRGQLIGILYLENNQCTGAFTGDRLEVLNLLCSQAAISLENARLYREAQQATLDLQQAQLQLVQNEKMATLGNLVAGVAHEINNPLSFITGNVKIIQNNLADLFTIVEGYRAELLNPSPQLAEQIEQLDLNFLIEDLPKTVASMQEGAKRIRNISTSLRTFSRTDKEAKTNFNLHEGIDSTLLILKYRLKANKHRPAIEIIKDYGDIPAVQCYPGQLNQVFMNILANAIDVFDEASEGHSFCKLKQNPQQIYIKTVGKQGEVLVTIADNGKGMSEQVKVRIFEQGFTTKGVGKGTGLGMAISRQIVEEKHGGAIICLSELGKGTEFIISLPRELRD